MIPCPTCCANFKLHIKRQIILIIYFQEMKKQRKVKLADKMNENTNDNTKDSLQYITIKKK